MDAKMTPMKDVLCNLIYNTDEFCALCFKAVGDNALRVQDDVYLEDQTVEEMLRVLSYVLGNEIFDSLSVYDPICDQCTRSAINSYTFKKMCKDNSKFLSTTVDGLAGCIGNTVEAIEDYKTVFLSINPNDTSSKQFYDSKRSSHIKSAAKRLKTLSTISKKSISQYNNYYSDNEDYRSDSEKLTVSPDDLLVERVEDKDFCTAFYSKDGKKYQCNSCLKMFSKFFNAERHYAIKHGGPKPVVIRENPEDRKNRICTEVIQDDVQKYQCNDCSAVCKTYGSVQCHYARYHADKTNKKAKLLMCSQCGKIFKDKYRLKKHELLHSSGDNKISCHICKKVYRSVGYLKVHICNPNNERIILPKPYACDICGRKYAQSNTLRYHIEYMHQREGHVCVWCKKKHPSRAALSEHMITHTRERNFKCEVCQGLFVTKAALTVHTRIHTGEKPYLCEAPGCDLRFISASRRSEHYKRRHVAPSIECDICHKIFRARQALLKHIRRHYNPRSSLFAPKPSGGR